MNSQRTNTSMAIEDILLPGEEGYPPKVPTFGETLLVLGYDQQESNQFLEKRIAPEDYYETEISKGEYYWFDNQTGVGFNARKAVEFGWKKELPFDFLKEHSKYLIFHDNFQKYFNNEIIADKRSEIIKHMSRYWYDLGYYTSLEHLELEAEKDPDRCKLLEKYLSSLEFEITTWRPQSIKSYLETMKVFLENYPVGSYYKNIDRWMRNEEGRLIKIHQTNLRTQKYFDVPTHQETIEILNKMLTDLHWVDQFMSGLGTHFDNFEMFKVLNHEMPLKTFV